MLSQTADARRALPSVDVHVARERNHMPRPRLLTEEPVHAPPQRAAEG